MEGEVFLSETCLQIIFAQYSLFQYEKVASLVYLSASEIHHATLQIRSLFPL